MADSVFFLFGLLLATLTIFHHQTICHAYTLFVFGDGLYDVGNKQFLAGNVIVSADYPPYGVTAGKATGRWSDGLVLPDYLAMFMGIPLVDPILDNKGNFSHGASFAVADATVLGDPPETMTLAQQLTNFSESKNNWTDKELSEAIYLFYIGGDDYLSFAKENPNSPDDLKQAFADNVTTAIEAALKAIYGMGGRKFAFQNLAPLGCLPIVKQENRNGNECVKLPSEMAALHNEKLLQLLRKLARELKGFQFSVYDFFSSIERRVSIPETYKFETGNSACCGTGSHNAIGCSTENVCFNPNKYVFFDGKHLTQEANFQTGTLIWSANPDVVGPNNLRELLVLPLDIPVVFGAMPNSEAASKDTHSKNHHVSGIRFLEWAAEKKNQAEGVSSFVRASL